MVTIRTKHLEGEMGVSRQEEALDRLLVDQDSGRISDNGRKQAEGHCSLRGKARNSG